jgi:SecD/SecF fusion protein
MKDLLPILVALLVLLAGAFAAAVAVVMLTSGSCSRFPQRPAVVLIYEVDRQEKEPDQPADAAKLVTAVDRRINPGGSTPARVRQLGDGRIEIGVFSSDPREVQRIERLLQCAATLELRILANQQDHAALIERAQREGSEVLRDAKGNVQAWWVPVHSPATLENQVHPGIMPGWGFAKRTRKQGQREATEVLVLKDPFDVTGAYLERAAPDQDDFGQPCVSFALNAAGARRLGALTSENLPDALQGFTRNLGILVDGQLYSAPAIQSPISAEGKITGSFSREQVRELVDVLNAGPLPAPIRLVERRTVGSEQ